jgi:cytochrome b561
MPVERLGHQLGGELPLKIFWIVGPLPNIVAPSKAVQHTAASVHLALFWTLATVVTVHVAAAFRIISSNATTC